MKNSLSADDFLMLIRAAQDRINRIDRKLDKADWSLHGTSKPPATLAYLMNRRARWIDLLYRLTNELDNETNHQ
jgi:hypothetical protein